MYKRIAAVLLVLFCSVLLSEAATHERAKLRWIRKKPPIRAIAIDGNSYFSDGYIRKRMYSRIRTFWGVLKGDRRTKVQRETFGRDTLEIKYIYLTHGFLGIQVTEDFEVMEPDSAALVRVTISEGRQFVYGKVSVLGDFGVRFREPFEKLLKRFHPGKPINFFAVRQTAFDMKTILANNGYPYGKVTSVLDTTATTNVTPVRFVVESDSLVRFGDIVITGTNRYPLYTARRELKVKPGDIYSRKAIIESERRLFESGYFSTVRLQQASEQVNRLAPDFVLHVRERKPSYVTIKTGAGQSEAADLIWNFSGGGGKRNLFGSRRVDFLARIEFTPGRDGRITDHNYRLRYTEPWFLGIRMPLSLSFTYQPEIQDKAQNFRVEQWSISISTNKRFSDHTRAAGGLEYQSVDIKGVPQELEEEVRREAEGLSVRRRWYASIIRDSRDNVFVPFHGSVRDLSVEYYGGFLGGDDNFFKLRASWSWFKVVWPGWVSASRVKSEWVNSFGASDVVPPKDRLFLGGANSIRGFAENSLAPLQSDSLPGAEFTFVFNQEFRWRTIQIFNPIPLLGDLFRNLPLWQSVFFDMGNGFRTIEAARISDFAFSYGTGIQIQSPAGPIRLDYARRIKTDSIDFADRWHFTILYAF